MKNRSLLLSNLDRIVGVAPTFTAQQSASLVYLLAKV